MPKQRPARQREPQEFLTRLAHSCIGHAAHYVNTPWGEAALAAYDDLAPLRVPPPPPRG